MAVLMVGGGIFARNREDDIRPLLECGGLKPILPFLGGRSDAACRVVIPLYAIPAATRMAERQGGVIRRNDLLAIPSPPPMPKPCPLHAAYQWPIVGIFCCGAVCRFAIWRLHRILELGSSPA